MSKTVASGDEVMRPIVAVRVTNDKTGKDKTIYAMLDSGADTDFISDTVVEELDIWTWEKDMTVVTVDQNLMSKRILASFTIGSVDDQYEAQVDAALVGRLVTGASDIPPSERDCGPFPHLQDIEFEKARGGVEMIIGAGHAEAWLGGEVKMGSMGEPMALNTLLGWTLVGTWGKKDTNSAALNFLSSEDGSLKEAVQGSVAPPKRSAGQAPQNSPQKKVQRVLSPPKGVLDRVS